MWSSRTAGPLGWSDIVGVPQLAAAESSAAAVKMRVRRARLGDRAEGCTLQHAGCS